MKQSTVFIIGVVAIAILATIVLLQPEDITIKQTYYTSSGEVAKFVYTVGADQAISLYQNHCARKGGIFNECGNPCEPGAEVCETVCAVTCEFNIS